MESVTTPRSIRNRNNNINEKNKSANFGFPSPIDSFEIEEDLPQEQLKQGINRFKSDKASNISYMLTKSTLPKNIMQSPKTYRSVSHIG